jgi:hypothetical protein
MLEVPRFVTRHVATCHGESLLSLILGSDDHSAIIASDSIELLITARSPSRSEILSEGRVASGLVADQMRRKNVWR